jgi:hypothetical protein
MMAGPPAVAAIVAATVYTPEHQDSAPAPPLICLFLSLSLCHINARFWMYV